MKYYFLEVETFHNKNRKILLYLILTLIIIAATILGITFADKINKNRQLKKAIKLHEQVLVAKDIFIAKWSTIDEENEVPIVEKVKPKLPQLTEAAITRFQNIYTVGEKKLAYLTFDDGPSKITPMILDILKENEIKATFFVLGNRVIPNRDILKRTYEEGHYVANHGYTHVYTNVYASQEALLNEFNMTEDAIREALELSEYSSHLFRFPGGSNGGKYRNIKNGARQLLLDNGAVYLDWNSLTGDSEGKYTKEAMLDHLYYTSEGKGNLVVLMHDSADKILTVEVLQDVINMLRGKGYEFGNMYDIMD